MLVKSKVGPQLNITGNRDATQWLLKGRPSVGVGIQTGIPGEVTAPIYWVYRLYENDFQPSNPKAGGYSLDPVLAAREYAFRWYSPVLPKNPWIGFITTPNEPVVQDAATMKWFAKFLAELIATLRTTYHVTAVVGNWSVGSPDFGLWVHYVPVLEAVIRYGAILGRHSYGPLDKFYALRHRTDNDIFGVLGYKNLPVILTEAGWENLSEVGFRAWGNPPRRTKQEYVSYLLALDAELQKDSYCLGASIFTYGIGWEQHNINDSGVGELFGSNVESRPLFEVSLLPPATTITNQWVLNVVGKTSPSGISRMPHDLLDNMIANRAQPYTGPDPRTWGLSEIEKQNVARELGLN